MKQLYDCYTTVEKGVLSGENGHHVPAMRQHGEKFWPLWPNV
jgi:hypothetical protein